MTTKSTAMRLPALSLALAVSLAGASLANPEPEAPLVLPTLFQAHRFVATPVTPAGQQLKLFTDSAGGTWIRGQVLQRLGMPTGSTTSLPEFAAGRLIPPPLGQQGRLAVRADQDGLLEHYDGMLGQQWFAGRTWTFDYPAQRLLWRAPGDLPPHSRGQEVKLGFAVNSKGERGANFARLAVEVDGQSLDFLLDTGATNVLSQEVLQQIGDGGPAERATSFLTRSQFEKWHARHPEWRWLDGIKTRTGTAMIEVPQITLANLTIGPVWFTVQPDRAFHEYMAQWMDKPSEGALGGSALQYVRLTVDWPGALAVVELPQQLDR